MNGGPIQVCPVCNYDLQSLPRNYRCPECGFEYEETMRVWVVSTHLAFKIIAYSLLGFSTLMLFVSILHHGFTARMRGFFFVPLILFLSSLIVAFVLGGWLRGFIVVGKHGVTHKYGLQKMAFRAWNEVRLNDSIWAADLVTGSPSLPRYLPAGYLKGTDRIELRDEILRRLIAFYNPPPESLQVVQADGPI